MPSPSTSPVTLPNRVSTPTFPVGIEVVLEKSRINSRIATMMRRKRFLKPEKFGMARSEPPKSKSPRPVVVMRFSPSQDWVELSAFRLQQSSYVAARSATWAEPEGLVTNNCRLFHRKSTPMQHHPYILCGLFLTLLASRLTIRRIHCFGRKAKQTQPLRSLGEARCNTCRAGRCSASIRNVPRADTDCERIFPVPMRGWNSVPVTAVPSKQNGREFDRAFACG